MASAGAIGGLAGVGFWTLRGAQPATPTPPALSAATPGTDPWSLQFERPGGGELRFADLRGKPLLVNFWATWCPPCVKELPLLDAFHRDQSPRGWHVVGLAVDSPTPVRDFLGRKPLGFAVGLAGLDGVNLAKSFGNDGGQLPFTVVFDRTGALRERRLGVVDEALLSTWARLHT